MMLILLARMPDMTQSCSLETPKHPALTSWRKCAAAGGARGKGWELIVGGGAARETGSENGVENRKGADSYKRADEMRKVNAGGSVIRKAKGPVDSGFERSSRDIAGDRGVIDSYRSPKNKSNQEDNAITAGALQLNRKLPKEFGGDD